ncbi:hypothetical protein ACQR3P_28795 [Rhodococcus sp. IEGM1300]
MQLNISDTVSITTLVLIGYKLKSRIRTSNSLLYYHFVLDNQDHILLMPETKTGELPMIAHRTKDEDSIQEYLMAHVYGVTI